MASEGQNENKIKRKRDIFSDFGVGRAVRGGGGGGGGGFKFYRKKLQLLSRFPGFRTIESRRAKK